MVLKEFAFSFFDLFQLGEEPCSELSLYKACRSVEGACPELVEETCPEPVEGICPELVEGQWHSKSSWRL